MPLELVSAVPQFTTLEQYAAYQSSTPASFDIPPVLHLHLENVTISLNPPLDAFSAESTRKGDVYITESNITFFDPSSSSGFAFTYPVLSLHAVSRSPAPSVYCQLDETEGNEEEDAEFDTRELIITPESEADVERVYSALCKCASLHPSADSPEANNIMLDSHLNPEESEVTEAGRNTMRNLEDMIDWGSIPTNRSTRLDDESDNFQDAPDDETVKPNGIMKH